MNHDLATMAVKACRDTWSPYNVQSDFLRHLGNRLFSCKSFFLAWVQRGWRTGTHRGADTSSLRTDRAIALEAIKNAKSQNIREIFSSFLPYRRSRDKDFMMEAVTTNPLAFKEASGYLFEDFDYMLLGISASKASLLPFTHKVDDFSRFAKFAATVRERISLAEGFVLYFLGAMSIDSTGGNRANKRRRTGRKSDYRCHLGMLGGEGSESIKRTTVLLDMLAFRSARISRCSVLRLRI